MRRLIAAVRSVAGLASLVTAAAVGPAAAQAAPDTAPKATRPRTAYEDMAMFSQVLNQIRVNHPDSIDQHELIVAAVEGMVHAADPHSFVVWFTPMSAAKEKAWEDGKLYPAPVTFEFIEGTPIVVGIAPGTAAAQLDILRGDALIAADGRAISSEREQELEIELAGPKKSMVKLTFERRRVDGTITTIQRDVKRERIDKGETAVPVAFMLDGKTGYIRINTFLGEDISDDLHRSIGRLQNHGMQRLILDLRANGGGRVDEAAKVAGEFLPSGALVYTSEGRKSEVTDTGRVKRSFWKSEQRFPIVLMVDEGTASASELVAGALQDHDRALIVGQPTFGKSLLMQGFPLGNATELYGYIELVIGHVRTPCGRVIQRQYHAMTRREYYRMARTARDTAGRPWCKTDNGRVVYGGGGIYPDIVFAARPPAPAWDYRILESDLQIKWVPGYISANQALFPSLDSLAAHPRIPDAGIAQFRDYVAKEGIIVPPGAESDSLLNRVLVKRIAQVKFGDEGFYRLAALLDADVFLAAGSFESAQRILGPAH